VRKYLFSLFALWLCAVAAEARGAWRDGRTKVLFETTLGNFTIALSDETPRHRDNFIRLVKAGFYDGLLFHRTIAGFMVQTGDPASRTAAPGQRLGDGGPGYTLPFEPDWPYRYHYRGAVAAAREPDEANPERRSHGSQFYVVWGKTYTPQRLSALADHVVAMTGGEALFTPEILQTYRSRGGAPHLDGQYTVFGEVVEGLKVIGKMQRVKTDAHDRPLTDVRILRATLLE